MSVTVFGVWAQLASSSSHSSGIIIIKYFEAFEAEERNFFIIPPRKNFFLSILCVKVIKTDLFELCLWTEGKVRGGYPVAF